MIALLVRSVGIRCGWFGKAGACPMLMLMLLAPGCAAAPPANPVAWESPRHVDHPLVGRIWDSRRQSFASPEELLAGLGGARFLLLGEKHDNADHHRLQLSVLESLIATNAVSGVAFEMIDAAKAGKLEGIVDRQFTDDAALKAWLEWDDGWDWGFYSPLLRAALDAGLPIRAANIGEGAIRAIYQGQARAPPDDVFDAAAMEKLFADIDQSHCGLLPESQFPAMARVQQSRDFSMANALLSLAAADATAVLIAGNYHARRNLGAPKFLLALEPARRRNEIISLSFVEVAAGETDPASYLERFGGTAEHDYLWFTPATPETDYCAQLR